MVNDILLYSLACIMCFTLAGVAEAVMDVLQFHYEKTPFAHFRNQSFWNPAVSWRNKYKNQDPTQGAKFPGSTSIFVAVTDAWHMFKSIRTASIMLGVFFIFAFIVGVWFAAAICIIARIIFGVTFTAVYNALKN